MPFSPDLCCIPFSLVSQENGIHHSFFCSATSGSRLSSRFSVYLAFRGQAVELVAAYSTQVPFSNWECALRDPLPVSDQAATVQLADS